MANFGRGASGALSGATSGALLGNLVPGIGTAIGAAGGGILGGLSGLFGGGNNGDRQQQINRYNPQQQQTLNNILQQAQSGLSNNKFDFAPKAAQARSNFAQNTIPSIAERFSQAGAQRSNSFAHALGSAGADLNSDLAGMEQDYNLQDRDHLMKLLGIGLSPQFDTIYEQGQGDDNGIGDFLNPQNLLNLYQLYNQFGSGSGSGGGAVGNTPDSGNAQQSSQNNLLKGNFGATSAIRNPLQYGLNIGAGKPQGGFSGIDFSSVGGAPKLNALRALAAQPNNLVNGFSGAKNAGGNNAFSNVAFANARSFENNRQNYINSFNR